MSNDVSKSPETGLGLETTVDERRRWAERQRLDVVNDDADPQIELYNWSRFAALLRDIDRLLAALSASREQSSPAAELDMPTLRKLLTEAAAGPWLLDDDKTYVEREYGRVTIAKSDFAWGINRNGANISLIVAAVNALPALLDIAERASREQSRLPFDLVAHLSHQRQWSEKTFGPGPRTKGVIDHIRKELAEIEADPSDLKEWVDVVILAFDGAWRAGWEPEKIVAAIEAKQAKNEQRKWPDWRTASADHAIEHDRTGEQSRLPAPEEVEAIITDLQFVRAGLFKSAPMSSVDRVDDAIDLLRRLAAPATGAGAWRPLHEMLRDGDAFVTITTGDGRPYIKIDFSDLTTAQRFHDVLIGLRGTAPPSIPDTEGKP